MTQVLDLAQPYLDASSYEESGMFPDVQNYDFFPCAEGEENCSRPKLVDNPEEFHPASDQVFYDLSPAEMQFTEMLHPTGQKTAHESSIETLPLMVPETQQNLAEDIFKSFPCLKDALATSGYVYVNSVVVKESPVHENTNSQQKLNQIITENAGLHDRFKVRSLSVDSAFANYHSETVRFLEGGISVSPTSAYSADVCSLEANSAIDLRTSQETESQFQQDSSTNNNENDILMNSIKLNEIDSLPIYNFYPSPREDEATDSGVGSSEELSGQIQFIPQSVEAHEMNSSSHDSFLTSEKDADENFHARSPESNSNPAMTYDLNSPQEILLPTTLDSISCDTSPEVSLESLPESLLHLDSVPAAKCAPVKTSSRRKRGRKLWEFLLDLLENPECNPSIIRWEDKSNGVFRLKEQEIIARKWGQRREKKDNLSYDYFARALRYHYKSRMLVSVPERKLVYKFGPKVLSEMK
ncbi:protein C-ets-2 [Hyalella azteca]|uniref:Protein C-ets-2 n=1 Tax=Hyalella azteca TaxID=294128 RepID=A0A8B7NH30_HYAAZ|nr:protein C-ets-2 [Hyalella azteca]